MGNWTTAGAAFEKRVDYIGFDIDEAYIEIAEERLEDLTTQPQ